MHTYTNRLLLGLAIAMMLPAMAMAAPPAPATGITASLEDGGVRVTWDAIDDQKSVRIYWSYISILENGGEYDDYVVMEGAANEYVIDNPPAVDTLYVSVILENTAGEQSPFFTEEASVTLGGAVQEEPAVAEESSSSSMEMASSSSEEGATSSAFVPASFGAETFASSSAAALPQDGKFHLLSAESVSATQVLLKFSHTVTIRPADAATAFAITTPDGRMLSLARLEILGDRVTITTDTQERGLPYVVTANNVVYGQLGTSPLPLGGGIETATFSGNALGKDPVAIMPLSNDLQLQATPLGGNMFRVEVALGGIPQEGVARFDIFQSIDGGRTFMGPQSVVPGTPSVRVDGVAAGAFVMTLQPILQDGSQGTPLTATLMLGQGTMPPPSSVTWQQPSSKPSTPAKPLPTPTLPGAGAGVVMLIGMTSGWAMMRRMRRTKPASSIVA